MKGLISSWKQNLKVYSTTINFSMYLLRKIVYLLEGPEAAGLLFAGGQFSGPVLFLKKIK